MAGKEVKIGKPENFCPKNILDKFTKGHRRIYEMEEITRKATTDDARFDDDRWLQKAEGGGSTAGGVAAHPKKMKRRLLTY